MLEHSDVFLYPLWALTAVWHIAGQDLKFVHPCLQVELHANHWREMRSTKSKDEMREDHLGWRRTSYDFRYDIKVEIQHSTECIETHQNTFLTCRFEEFASQIDLYSRGDQNSNGAIFCSHRVIQRCSEGGNEKTAISSFYWYLIDTDNSPKLYNLIKPLRRTNCDQRIQQQINWISTVNFTWQQIQITMTQLQILYIIP